MIRQQFFCGSHKRSLEGGLTEYRLKQHFYPWNEQKNNQLIDKIKNGRIQLVYPETKILHFPLVSPKQHPHTNICFISNRQFWRFLPILPKQSSTLCPHYRELDIMLTLFLPLAILAIIHSQPLYNQTEIYKDPLQHLYYIYLHIGTPSIRYLFRLDTSSSMISLDCRLCGYCRLSDNSLYDLHPSSTQLNLTCQHPSPYCSNCKEASKDVGCEFNKIVNNNHLSGYLIQDFLFMPSTGDNKQATPHNSIVFEKNLSPIECVVESSAPMITDGVVGLSPHSFDPNSSLYSQHPRNPQSFSLCFSQKGGMFYLGKVDIPSSVRQVTAVGYEFNEDHYEIPLVDVAVGGIRFNLKSGENSTVRIDSNTYNSVFPLIHYNKLVTILGEVCRSTECKVAEEVNRSCFKLTSSQYLHRFPNISILINSSKIEWNPANYLGRSLNVYCLKVEPGTVFTLGISWMVHRLIRFDISEQTITIVDSDCEDKHYSNKDQEPDSEEDEIFLGLAFETLLLCITLMILIGIILGILFKKYWRRGYIRDSGVQADRESKPSINLVEENVEDLDFDDQTNPTNSVLQ